jgi:hypothetical protein
MSDARASDLQQDIAQVVQAQALVAFMRQSPLYGFDQIAFERDRSTTRPSATDA